MQTDGLFSDRQRDILAVAGLLLAILHTTLVVRSFFNERNRKLALPEINLELISDFFYYNRATLTCFVVIWTVPLLLACLFERSGSILLLWALVLSAEFLLWPTAFLILKLGDPDHLKIIKLASIFSFPLICWLILTFAHLARPTSWLARALIDQLPVLGAPGALMGLMYFLIAFKQIREDWFCRIEERRNESLLADLARAHPDIKITPDLHDNMIQFLSDTGRKDNFFLEDIEAAFLQEHAVLTQTSTGKMKKRGKQATKSSTDRTDLRLNSA